MKEQIQPHKTTLYWCFQHTSLNILSFPDDFMFEMNKEEFQNWRSQFVTSKEYQQGLPYMLFCFTEQGVTMLSCIMNSGRAIQVNIQIIHSLLVSGNALR